MEKALLHDVAQYYKFDVMSAELEYQMYLSGTLGKPCPPPTARPHQSTKESSPKSNLAKEIEKAREKIKSLNTSSPAVSGGDASQMDEVLRDNKELRSMVEALTVRVKQLEEKVTKLSLGGATEPNPSEAKPTVNGDDGADDDDFDLFGDDDDEEEEDDEKEREKQERLKAYHDKKSKKPKVIAKSNVILEVKPWDDETDMSAMERSVRSIEMDGLLWGTAKLVPVGYGIKKLQISCVVEDEKVSVDDLEEKITSFEDFVQSVDIAAFNKI